MNDFRAFVGYELVISAWNLVPCSGNQLSIIILSNYICKSFRGGPRVVREIERSIPFRGGSVGGPRGSAKCMPTI